ncbi:MAG: macro domain-containing protein [bacterium]
MQFNIKKVSVEVIEGDLITIDSDAYVCPMNIKYNLNYGIGEVLSKYAGEEFLQSLKAKENPEMGTVFAVRGGKLKAKYILIAVIEDENHEVARENITKVMEHCFRLSDAMNLKSIAFPMLGSPRSKVPYDTFTKLMVRSTFNYFTTGNEGSLNMKFVLFNKELYHSFVDQLNVLRQEFFI